MSKLCDSIQLSKQFVYLFKDENKKNIKNKQNHEDPNFTFKPNITVSQEKVRSKTVIKKHKCEFQANHQRMGTIDRKTLKRSDLKLDNAYIELKLLGLHVPLDKNSPVLPMYLENHEIPNDRLIIYTEAFHLLDNDMDGKLSTRTIDISSKFMLTDRMQCRINKDVYANTIRNRDV